VRQLRQADCVIQIVLAWAKTQPAIRAVALVGSYARGTARADSDIDLVVLATDPAFFRVNSVWLEAIDWHAIGARPLRWQDESYGPLWSRRAWLEHDRGEVEISFAATSWADVKPLDSGTQQVIAGGCRILHDPDGLLTRLCAAVRDGVT
jgi:hypothetical protein